MNELLEVLKDKVKNKNTILGLTIKELAYFMKDLGCKIYCFQLKNI